MAMLSAFILSKVQINPQPAWEWLGAAFRAMAIPVLITGNVLFFRETSAYTPLFVIIGFVGIYDAVLAFLLLQKRVRQAFVAGFFLDNLTLAVGWWMAARGLSDTGETTDLYLILLPFLIVGIVRLGWISGLAFTLIWLGWLVWITMHYLGPETYAYEQLPVRVTLLLVTLLLVIRLVFLLNRERRLETRRLREMEGLENLKSGMLRTVSHELKSPVTAIKGAVSILSQASQHITPDQRTRALRVLGNSTSRLERIIDESLEYALIRETVGKSFMEENDLSVLVQEAVERVQQALHAKSQTLRTELPPYPCRAVVDYAQMTTVVIQLLTNAIQFYPVNGEIYVSLYREAPSLILAVKDSGPGIPENVKSLIFSEFYRGEPADRFVGKGTGLGLAQAKKLVENHGGTLELTSERGQGSAFFVRIPEAVR